MSHNEVTVIHQKTAQAWKVIRYFALGYIIFFFLLGGIIGFLEKKSIAGFTIVFGAIGIFTAIITLGVFWISTRRPITKNLREKSYLRTTGPIKVTPYFGGAIIQLADRAFLTNDKKAFQELSKVKEGMIDYSTHAHVIFAAWDNNGDVIYCAPSYKIQAFMIGIPG